MTRSLLLLVLASVLAACGGGAPVASATSSSLAPQPSAGGGATPPASAAGDLIACELLGDEEIAQIVDGAIIGSMIDDAQDTIHANHCRWTLQDGSGGMLGQVDLGIRSPGGRSLYDESFAILGWDAVEGLPADDAIRDPDAGGIVAVRGDVLVDVFTVFLSDEQELALMERALANVAAR